MKVKCFPVPKAASSWLHGGMGGGGGGVTAEPHDVTDWPINEKTFQNIVIKTTSPLWECLNVPTYHIGNIQE